VTRPILNSVRSEPARCSGAGRLWLECPHDEDILDLLLSFLPARAAGATRSFCGSAAGPWPVAPAPETSRGSGVLLLSLGNQWASAAGCSACRGWMARPRPLRTVRLGLVGGGISRYAGPVREPISPACGRRFAGRIGCDLRRWHAAGQGLAGTGPAGVVREPELGQGLRRRVIRDGRVCRLDYERAGERLTRCGWLVAG